MISLIKCIILYDCKVLRKVCYIDDMINFNVDLAVECIKTICDNTQCVTCDKLSGQFVRFPCGHSVCKHCAEKSGECLSCISSQSGTYLVDNPQTDRLNNVSALLSAFQDAFEIDVYKRQRISDHLKLEKQVFPRCIQAPQKYCNKRKSFNFSISNKENLNQTIFPGEEVINTDTAKMKKSFQYVQNWLNQHEDIQKNVPRKPFGDININTQSLLNTRKKNLIKSSKGKNDNIKKSPYVKRTHVKSINTSTSFLNNWAREGVKNDMKKSTILGAEVNKEEKCPIPHKCDRNESGIVIDDEPIVLDDTEEVIDKDKLAWLAVLEADKRDQCEDDRILSQRIITHGDNYLISYENNDSGHLDVNKSDSAAVDDSKGVLFYKKGCLSDPCKLCRKYVYEQTNLNTTEDTKDVSIVINNSAFVTTIKFSQCVQHKQEMSHKKSVEIQTVLPQSEAKNDVGNMSLQKRKNLENDKARRPTKMIRPEVAIQSLDVFATTETKECTKVESNVCLDAVQNNCNESKTHLKSVVIEDSDTESDISNDNNMYEVVAEVHKTSSAPEIVAHGILTPTTSKPKYQDRLIQPKRGHTPNSTDSSDKENLDPNRSKKVKLGKKQKHKIKKNYKL